eukprot:Platyproteum_vivax@DN10170_c0_g1_i1.p1
MIPTTYRCLQLDQDGVDDRAYRLLHNDSLKVVDKMVLGCGSMSAINNMLYATAICPLAQDRSVSRNMQRFTKATAGFVYGSVIAMAWSVFMLSVCSPRPGKPRLRPIVPHSMK